MMGLYTLDDCQWWFLNDGIFITGWSRFFAMLLLGIFFTALARWDHDPWRWCRCVHSMFYLTWFFHIHITIHNYTNLYQFIYQSISFYIIYLWFTWFILLLFYLFKLTFFGIFWPSLWAPASLWLRQVGKNYLTWPGGQSPRPCHDVWPGMSQVRFFLLWTRSHVVSRCFTIC